MEKWSSNNTESSPTTDHNKVWESAGENKERRNWEMLDYDVLAIIWTMLPTDALARVVPFVCRAWREMMAGSHCLTVIDIEEWCEQVRHVDVIDDVVRKLVRQSSHTLQRLNASGIGNSGFSLTASFGKHLKVLQIPMSKVNDDSIDEFSGTLTSLKELDISHCHNITSKGIKILGKNCMSLIELKRNKTFFEHLFEPNKINEDEALAVANTMPGLQKLELVGGLFSDYGLNTILISCKALSSLNICGCIAVNLVGDVGSMCNALKFFVKPSDMFFDLYSGSDDDWLD